MPSTPATQVWFHSHPVHITAGIGSLKLLPTLLPPKERVLLVTSAGFTRRGMTQRLLENLGSDYLVVYDQVKPNPELDDLDEATLRFRAESPAAIIALGGGSVMDAAKVLAVTLLCNRNYPLADIFRNGVHPEWHGRLPVITIPTTSGTGAEVTPFATVWDRTTHKKHSLAGDFMYPAHALLDAEQTASLPRDETLYTGLDTISHAMESLWNKHRTPISVALSLQALSIAVNALPTVLKRPMDMLARENMQQASLLAGLAISQTRTAVAHSLSYPLTSHLDVPHGLACSFTLPELLRLNMPTLTAENPHQESLFTALLEVLQSFNLHKEVARYASPAKVKDLKQYMINKDRIENFSGTIGAGLDELLHRSLIKS